MAIEQARCLPASWMLDGELTIRRLAAGRLLRGGGAILKSCIGAKEVSRIERRRSHNQCSAYRGFEVDAGVVVPDDDFADERIPRDVPDDEFESLSPFPVQQDGRDSDDGRSLAPNGPEREQGGRVGRRAGLDQVDEAGMVGLLHIGRRFGDVPPREVVFVYPRGRLYDTRRVEGGARDERDLEGEVARHQDEAESEAAPDRIGVGQGREDSIDDDDRVRGRYERQDVLQCGPRQVE